MSDKKKTMVEFDEKIINHYEDLGMVTPFSKFVEMIVYARVQLLLDQYMAQAVQEEVRVQEEASQDQK